MDAMTPERGEAIKQDIYAQVRAIRPDLYERCVRLGVATRETVQRGYSAQIVGDGAEEMAVLLIAMALNLRPADVLSVPRAAKP
jgi:hypothetical protein